MQSLTAEMIGQIRALYETLSKSQRKVVDFILAHEVDAAYLPAARIADLIGVNRSTVVRTAQALGYEGFPELQAALQDGILKHTTLSDRVQITSALWSQAADRQEEGGQSTLRKVVQNEILNLSKLLNQVSEADFEHAVDLLDKARKVFIMGPGYALPKAIMFGKMLRFVRSQVVILESSPAYSLSEQLEDMTPEDVLLAFSYTPHLKQTLRCMEYACANRTPVILIAESAVSQASIRADLVLVAPGTLLAPGYTLAPYALLNALHSALIFRHPEHTKQRLNYLDRIDNFFDIFDRDDPHRD